jgi:hypothetical protein
MALCVQCVARPAALQTTPGPSPLPLVFVNRLTTIAFGFTHTPFPLLVVKTIEATEGNKNKYVTILTVLLIGSAVIPMVRSRPSPSWLVLCFL